MATAWVILAEADADTVRMGLLRGLPRLGYDGWLSRLQLGAADPAQQVAARAACQVVLVVATPALFDLPHWRDELAHAVAAPGAAIVLRLAGAPALPEDLAVRPTVEFGEPGDDGDAQARQRLGALLPPAGPDDPARAAGLPVETIEWNEELFSEALQESALRHDHSGAVALLDALERHLARRRWPYPPRHAEGDLQVLRRERAFAPMRRLAEMQIGSGTRTDRVRRLYAQALIETGALDMALEVLQSVIDGSDSSAGEVAEAQGLVGRVFKQRYVDAPLAPEAPTWLLRAIEAYGQVFDDDPGQAWHGVNAASCLLRAERDGLLPDAGPRAQSIALQVLDRLGQRERQGPLDVWDCASRAEAQIALQNYAGAETAVLAYLRHRDMHAFEVSSTCRQFDQVLELGRRQPGGSILARLREAVLRYRARLAPAPAADAAYRRPLQIRLADAQWEPVGIPGLEWQSRLGTIVSARGTAESVRALLADPHVISVVESRPVGRTGDCDRSLPFIGVAARYDAPAGPFEERGERALIAVIDEGIDVLHPAFLDAAGASRIVGVWDQTARTGTPPPGFGYGHFHDAASLHAAAAAAQWPAGLPRDDDGHGTHVASIAAGRAAGGFAGGVAPEARLLVVISDASGPTGFLNAHLDALSFIDRFATGLGLPVVVNLSQGMNAGAHDGKSGLETAFDTFVDSGRRPGRVVVKSAGNERARKGHALVTLRPNSVEALCWERVAGADFGERIELWWSSADEMRFRLQEPTGGQVSDWVAPATPSRGGTFGGAGSYQMEFVQRHPDNGDNLLLVELGSPAAPAALGTWTLEIESGRAPDGGVIHAWIERSLGEPTAFTRHANETMTLSIPATASSVIAVGAVDAARPVRVYERSSYGPTRLGQQSPWVSAPGVKVKAARGGSGGTMERSGTSMAAPHVAGAIALVLSRTAKAGRVAGRNQIAQVLRQKARDFNGQWDPGQGWGVIDVAAVLAAF